MQTARRRGLRRCILSPQSEEADRRPLISRSRIAKYTPMPNHLIFSAIDVARVVADAMRATSEQRRPTLEQLIKGGAYNDNLDLNEEIRESIRNGLSPELHLVKDQGVYLMPNAWFEEGDIAIAFAEGCDPKKDRDTYYFNSREIMGGDDSSNALPLEPFKGLLEQGSEAIVIVVKPDCFEICGR
jgi:hypothetical protein